MFLTKMKIMKKSKSMKIVQFILIGFLLFSLFSCESTETPESTDTTEPVVIEPVIEPVIEEEKPVEKEDKIEITYEQFIAGALLKFGNLDNVDICLLREDFESRMNAKITGRWYSISTIGSYI